MSALSRLTIATLLMTMLFALPLAATQPAEAQMRLNAARAEQPVRLTALSVSTNIQGGFAETTLEMIFHNPNHRILEGQLEFPLSPGQEISGLALDINGQLRQAVPVPKARGQEVFEAISRRRVDPALLEAARGNVYRLRVYPLPANGTRRVALKVMQPLEFDGQRLRYRLPLDFDQRPDTVSIEAEIISAAGPPQVTGGPGLKLTQAGTVYRGRLDLTGSKPLGRMDISLPAPDSLSRSAAPVRWGDRLYFSTVARVSVPNQPRRLPDRVTILWDASASGQDRDQARELDLLGKYFQAFGSGRVRLIVLRDKAEPARDFTVAKGDWRQLRQALAEVVYDGASALADWEPEPGCPEYLLFSDGLDNYRGGQARQMPELAEGQRLFAVNSSPKADYPLLRALSENGGALIDLTEDHPELAEAKLLRAGARARVQADLGPLAAAAVGPESAYVSSYGGGGLIRLAGWFKKNGPLDIPIHITFSDGSTKIVRVARPIPARSPDWPDPDQAPLAARLWGRYAIAELERDSWANRQAIAELGDELGVVSNQTSLIVLETPEDYAQYGVKAPAELREQVAALAGRLREIKASGEEELDTKQVYDLWQPKMSWWLRDHEARIKIEKSPQSTRPRSKPEKKPAAPSSADSPKVYTGDRFSLNFQNAEIHNVIRAIGEVSGKNIVISDQVSGRITLNLKDTPWDQALDIILAARNLGMEEHGNVITVYDLPTLNSIRAGRERVAAESQQRLSVAPKSRSSVTPPETILAIAPEGSSANLAAPVKSSINTVLGGGISLQTQYRTDYESRRSGQSNQVRAYLDRLRSAADDELYPIYLDERPDHQDDPAFFVAVAELFLEKGQRDLGLRILSNLAELNLESRPAMRELAYRLLARDEPGPARHLLERVRQLAPYEPQSWRDLAEAEAAGGRLQTAADLLREVVTHKWDARFRDINLIAMTDLNYLLDPQAAGRVVHSGYVDPYKFNGLTWNLKSDLRAVLSWNQDDTDLDLQITDPDGRVLNPKVRYPSQAGYISRDCTQGYGPEEFMLKKAKSGIYKVAVVNRRHSRQTLGDRVTAYLTVYQNFGRPNQSRQSYVVDLAGGDMRPLEVATVSFSAAYHPDDLQALKEIAAQIPGEPSLRHWLTGQPAAPARQALDFNHRLAKKINLRKRIPDDSPLRPWLDDRFSKRSVWGMAEDGHYRLLELDLSGLSQSPQRLDLPALPYLNRLILNDNPTLESVHGLERLKALDSLNLSKTAVESVSIAGNPKLSYLTVVEARLLYLTIPPRSNLENLNVAKNHLTRLDLRDQPKLRVVSAEKMPSLKDVRLEHLPNLIILNLQQAGISRLDFKGLPRLGMLNLDGCRHLRQVSSWANLPKLHNLNISNTSLESVDLTFNKDILNLSAVNVPRLSVLKLPQAASISALKVVGTDISQLDLGLRPTLFQLRLDDNPKLGHLEFSSLKSLIALSIAGTDLRDFDLTGSPKLNIFNASRTLIDNFDFSDNPHLQAVNLSQTPVEAVSFQANPELRWLDLSNTVVKQLDLTDNKNMAGLNIAGTAIDELKFDADLARLFTDHPDRLTKAQRARVKDLADTGRYHQPVPLAQALPRSSRPNHRVFVSAQLDDLLPQVEVGKKYKLQDLSPTVFKLMKNQPGDFELKVSRLSPSDLLSHIFWTLDKSFTWAQLGDDAPADRFLRTVVHSWRKADDKSCKFDPVSNVLICNRPGQFHLTLTTNSTHLLLPGAKAARPPER